MRIPVLAILALLAATPAMAQSGVTTPNSSGVVSGQNWNTGQDTRRFESTEAARRRAEVQRRNRQPQRYTGVGRPVPATTAPR